MRFLSFKFPLDLLNWDNFYPAYRFYMTQLLWEFQSKLSGKSPPKKGTFWKLSTCTENVSHWRCSFCHLLPREFILITNGVFPIHQIAVDIKALSILHFPLRVGDHLLKIGYSQGNLLKGIVIWFVRRDGIELIKGVSYLLLFSVIIIITYSLMRKKENYLNIGHFTTLSGHFFANYINIFHKTEVLMKILRCETCLNLNWIKNYEIKHITFFVSVFFNFVRKKMKICDS